MIGAVLEKHFAAASAAPEAEDVPPAAGSFGAAVARHFAGASSASAAHSAASRRSITMSVDRTPGEQLLEQAELAADAEALLEAAVGLAGAESGEAEAEDDEGVPPPWALFDALAGRRHPELRRRLAGRFEVVAMPGALPGAAPMPGDIVVRRGIGDGGLAHVAVIAGPALHDRDDALAGGWRIEGGRPGSYMLVVEPGPFPHRRDDGFARRILDPAGRLPLDTLLLRLPARTLIPPAPQETEHAPPDEQTTAPAATSSSTSSSATSSATAPATDTPLANSFVAAHRSRWCTPGDRRSGTCRRIASPRPIRRVIIHTLAVPTTSRRTGAQSVVLAWQREGRAASAHYIIDRDGTTTQMVREADVAFHAGSVNSDSVGIEHADICNDPAPLTRELYERSAALVRDIARRAGFTPLVYGVDTTDVARATVSGHVHNSGPGGHGDPGPYWDWQYYALLLAWDGTTEASRPLRAAWTTQDATVTTRPTGWAVQRRRSVPNSHCASRSDPYGAAFWKARAGSGPAAEFTLTVEAPGTYELSLWWPRVSGASSSTGVEFQLAGGAATSVTVDQRRDYGRWFPLTSTLSVATAPTTLTVRIARPASGSGWAVADGVRLLRLRGTP